MATFRKRNNRWQAIVRRGDCLPQYRSFRTKKEAQDWATSIEDAINKDEYIPSAAAKKRTVQDMLERYRKTEIPKKRDQVNSERHVKFWIDKIGTVRLVRLTRALVIEIRDDMATRRAHGTVNRYLAVLSHACRLAATDWGWMNANPLTRIKLSEPRGRVRHLDQSEVKALLAATKQSDHPQLYAIVMIALTTGARRGEIIGLHWSDVDLKARRAVLHQTKNDERRTLALVPQVIDELNKLKKVRRIANDLIFSDPDSGNAAYFHFEEAWRVARDEAGIKDFRFHDLRHTFASFMAMDGRTTAEIAGALGHKTLAMVKRYSHLSDTHVQTAMEQTGLKVLGDG